MVITKKLVLLLACATLLAAGEASQKTLNSARTLLKSDDIDGARTLLAKVIEAEPDNPDALLLLAQCDEKAGDSVAALGRYERVLELSETEGAVTDATRRDAEKAVLKLDEGRRIIAQAIAMLEREAAKLKGKNDLAYETVQAAIETLKEKNFIAEAAEREVTKRPPKSAIEFEGRRYVVVATEVTWHEARRRCEELGGHLATATSISEVEFIRRLAMGNG